MRRQVTIIVAVAGLTFGPATVAGADPWHQDANLASTTASQPLRTTDPRSPDARDAQTLVVVPAGLITKAASTVSSPSSDDGFGWSDVGIGAGGLAVLALLGLGAGFAVRRHRETSAPLAH